MQKCSAGAASCTFFRFENWRALVAIDTLGIFSEPITEQLAQHLEQQCVLRQGTDLRTGEILYRLTSGFLEGSHDHRICFRVERSRWKTVKKGPPVRAFCQPYVYLEGSVHKAILGHNVYGGPRDFQETARWLVDTMMVLFRVELPLASSWTLKRVDTSEVYQLPSYEAVSEYFRGLNASDYPRRQINRYGLSGLYAAGRTTATKFYHKGVEFAKHDRSRLKRLLSASQLNELQELANKLIRVEVEIKSEKLDYDFGCAPRVEVIQNSYLDKVFDQETYRILRDGEKEMETVREARAVQCRLNEIYNSRLAGILFGTWFQLSALGEEAVKTSMKRATFYLQRKQLIEAGCDWHGTDVILKEHSLIPPGFSLRRGSPWYLSDEHPKVIEEMSIYRSIA
jgi:II/X family phage/plasmid replication protein